VTLSAAQTLIVAQVGDEVTTAWPGGVLATNIAAVWDGYADSPTELQKLYTRRDCIDLVLGVVRGQVDFQIANDHSRKQQQKAATLLSMRQACLDDIDRAITTLGSAGAVGAITKTAPVMPTPDQLDPSARRYRGDRGAGHHRYRRRGGDRLGRRAVHARVFADAGRYRG
jgi:hypothetical protein